VGGCFAWTTPATGPSPGGSDRAVANAADAWLSEPRDLQAYHRLIDAVIRRRAWLHPTLGFAAINTPDPPEEIGPELLDALADTNPPRPLGQAIAAEWQPHIPPDAESDDTPPE